MYATIYTPKKSKILGIYALSLQLLERLNNHFLIFLIGYTVPLIGVGENADVSLTLTDEVGNNRGKEELALLGILRKIFLKECGEALGALPSSFEKRKKRSCSVYGVGICRALQLHTTVQETLWDYTGTISGKLTIPTLNIRPAKKGKQHGIMGRLSRVGVIRLALREQGRYTVQTTRRFPSCLVIIPQRRRFVNIQKCQFSSQNFVRNAPCRKNDINSCTFLFKMLIF